MLAIKNRVVCGILCIIAPAVLFMGCGPPGPRALLDGKRLLDKGQYAQAIERLKSATTLLSTNANAWNYLGVAYHRAGQPTNAVVAYQKALILNRDLLEARFNLGCLWLEQDNADAAKAEFTAYTLRRPNAPEGWTKLGFAQLRSRDIAAAEKSFAEALRRNAQTADALNGLGLAQLQRNRPREAAQYFAGALKVQPDHRPTLLNLARVLDAYLNDRPAALNRYREYLALKPRAADWDSVNAVAQAIEHQLQPPVVQPHHTEPTVAAPVVTKPTQVTTQAVAPVTVKSQPVNTQAVASHPPALSKPEPARPVTSSPPEPSTPAEIVTLPPAPVIRGSSEVTSATPASKPAVAPESEPVVTSASTQAEKRSLLQKLNPMNIFRRESDVTPMTNPPSSGTSQSRMQPPTNTATARAETPGPSTSASRPPSIRRYSYVSPRSPAPGNRAAAESQFAKGVQLREAGRWSDAAQFFRQAAKADPSHWGAQFNLALAEYELQQYKKSLPVWEMTLAIRPDSTDARYNFALALKASAFPVDAANELEKVLAAHPEEARAHLTLGNLCAEQLQDTARAREHYLKVLDLNPIHPQASAIRSWLVSNPQ
jgi:tetratricopeptide (TPR) repeat protein